MKTILIATDGSEPAGQALDVAIDLARADRGGTRGALRAAAAASRARRRRPCDPRGRRARRPRAHRRGRRAAGSRGRRCGHAALGSRRRRERYLRRRDLAARRLARRRISRARSALRCRSRQRLARACEPFAGAGDDRSPGRCARHGQRLSLAAENPERARLGRALSYRRRLELRDQGVLEEHRAGV